MARRPAADQLPPPHELEVHGLDPRLPFDGWQVAGSYPSLAEAETALLGRLATGVPHDWDRARVRQYGPGRSTAEGLRVWELEGPVARIVEGAFT